MTNTDQRDKESSQINEKEKQTLKHPVFDWIMVVVALCWMSIVHLVLSTWKDLTMEQLMFQIREPVEGTATSMIASAVAWILVPVAVGILVFILLRHFTGKKMQLTYVLLMVGGLVVATCVAAMRLNPVGYVVAQATDSDFIGKYYASPEDTKISFPENKRNLIYIFLESMEITYADKNNGGIFDQNTIPELTILAQENEDFSGAQTTLNGGISLSGSTWTIGAMFAQTSGLPLKSNVYNDMDTQDSFFSGVITLGDILEEEGYNQELMVGSDASFGGRALYFKGHGDYDIWDYNTAVEEEKISSDYYVHWGYEDQKLFSYAKEELERLSSEDKPFNFTMLTVDTHFPLGYVCDLCSDEFGDDQYANVMACSSRQVAAFVEWIKEQDFYDNTTIVITGDHPTMNGDFTSAADKDYVRKTYTAIINSPIEKECEETRLFSTMDLFPTTLAAIGAKIEGNALGLGVNLYSDRQTLLEEYGLEEVKSELNKHSAFLDRLEQFDCKDIIYLKRRKTEESVWIKVVSKNEDNLQLKISGVKTVTGKDAEDISEVTVLLYDEDEELIEEKNATLGENNAWLASIDANENQIKAGTLAVTVTDIDEAIQTVYCENGTVLLGAEKE